MRTERRSPVRSTLSFILLSIAVAIASLLPAAPEPGPARMDTMLRLLLRRHDETWRHQAAGEIEASDGTLRAYAAITRLDTSGDELVVPVLVLVRDDGREMRARGFRGRWCASRREMKAQTAFMRPESSVREGATASTSTYARRAPSHC
jgi:hypothetical protein